jgi:hypothetical protein
MFMRRAIWGVGRGLRETGQAIERMGARAQVFTPPAESCQDDRRRCALLPLFCCFLCVSQTNAMSNNCSLGRAAPASGGTTHPFRSTHRSSPSHPPARSAQDNWIFQEKLCRHRAVMNLFDQRPKLAAAVFVAPNASVIGSVEINTCSSVWCASARARRVRRLLFSGDRPRHADSAASAAAKAPRPDRCG